MRLAVDPVVLAIAATPAATGARGMLLEHTCFLPGNVMARLAEVRPGWESHASLQGKAAWDLMEALVARVRIVDESDYAEYLALARRMVAARFAHTLALGLQMEVDAILAGGPSFDAQDLIPVMAAWPKATQRRL